jgi:hypothetical protein
MSVGPLVGINVSAAGTPLAQAKGSDVDKSTQDVGAQSRSTVYEKKAEAAAGIGETDGEEHQTDERDADGRRLWEFTEKNPKNPDNDVANRSRSRDATGESGNLLDLSG